MTTNTKPLFLPALLVGLLATAGVAQVPAIDPINADGMLDAVAAHVRSGLAHYPVDSTRIPRSIEPDGSIRGVPPSDWTSGFFAGVLWQLGEHLDDARLLAAAAEWTRLLHAQAGIPSDHDLGFRIYNSYGHGHRITGDPISRDGIVRAADALASRFDMNVGAIKSWDGDWGGWKYPVIIDNMMNLELLFAATRLTGDSAYFNIAVQHANTTDAHHFREDGSSWHVLDYNPDTGTVLQRQTHQGAADGSAWARGQSWGLYGFTMTYGETRDERYLDRARDIAGFLLDHPNLPDDGIPYWDYDAPGIPHTNRDASAAAIMASALYKLQEYVPESEADRYLATADRIVTSLWRDYRAPADIWPFVLDRSVGNMNGPDEVGVPIIYADYYFIEALRRKLGVE